MRLLVLTGIILTAATAVAGAQPGGHWPADRAPDAVVAGAVDQDHDRRPGSAPLVATAGSAPSLPPAGDAVPADPVALVDSARPAAVIPFAPKTSPPRARWFQS